MHNAHSTVCCTICLLDIESCSLIDMCFLLPLGLERVQNLHCVATRALTLYHCTETSFWVQLEFLIKLLL